MINIAICDDDNTEITKTTSLIREVMGEKKVDVKITAFGSPAEMIDYVKSKPAIDIMFLDIVMPNTNGIDLGLFIREVGLEVPIVYTSSFRDYAFDSYAVHASDYLLKPIDKDKLEATLTKLLNEVSSKPSKEISIKTKNGLQMIDPKQLTYIECVARCNQYHLADGSVISSITNRGSFEESMAFLGDQKSLIQIHKSFFVNLNYMKELRVSSVILSNGEELPVSRNQKNSVKEAYLNFFTN